MKSVFDSAASESLQKGHIKINYIIATDLSTYFVVTDGLVKHLSDLHIVYLICVLQYTSKTQSDMFLCS